MATAASDGFPLVAPALSHTVGASFRVRGLHCTDHTFVVPLDHWVPGDARTVSVFAREVVAAEKAGASDDKAPWLFFLQGGPGFESPRPAEASGWIKAAVDAGNRVLLLDQRGTGRSTRISSLALATQFESPAAAAEYCSHFRADSIVADCEAVRQALGVATWTGLGQSFGGFCLCTYLSFAPHGLKEALITGGLAPSVALTCPQAVDGVYTRLFDRVLTQTSKYYTRFPGDAAIMRDIVLHLAAQPGMGVDTPSGGRLTPHTLQLLGWGLGSASGFESLHYLLENAWETELSSGKMQEKTLSLAFLRGFEATLPFDANPLYALLHEACYGNGGSTQWSAQRVREERPIEKAALDPVAAAREGRMVPLTGEMVFPFLFDDVASLRQVKAVAHELAKREWRPLYDAQALARNVVPVAATAYFEDMYVDFNLAQETAACIAGARVWVTNEFTHSGVREDGPRVLKTLLALARGEEPLR